MKRKRLPINYSGNETTDNSLSVASANECTGLVPANPENNMESETYGQIYDIPMAPKKKKKNR